MSFIEQGLIQGKVVSIHSDALVCDGVSLIERIQQGNFLVKNESFEGVVGALSFVDDKLLFAMNTQLGLLPLPSGRIVMKDNGSDIRALCAYDDIHVITGDHLGMVRLWQVSESELSLVKNWEFRRAIDGLKKVGDSVLVHCGWPRPEIVILNIQEPSFFSVYQGKDICSMDLSRSGIAAVGTFSGDVAVRQGEQLLESFSTVSCRGMVRVHFVEREANIKPFLLAIGFQGVWGFDLETRQHYQLIVPDHIATTASMGPSVYVNTFSRGVFEVGLAGIEGDGSHLQIIMKPIVSDVGVFKEFVMMPDRNGVLQPVGLLLGGDLTAGGVPAKNVKFCNRLALDFERGRLAVGGASLCVYSR